MTTHKLFWIQFNDSDKTIYIRDTQDVWNETSAYNKKIRAYKKGVELFNKSLEAGEINDETTFNEIVNMFDEIGLDMRTYCAMD